ncbi:cupin domain-containing protein [Fodinibius saliphilus]|uniref:cupin domain-containing protein n=1 Tax=Fodinibius saliphilus TaxID=1920650 RepID=UPI00110833AA|nr:cupin domain-containing protein [Fodinibius saliphilus]
MKTDKTVDEIVDALELKPHPEGGYYRETYRSKNKVKGAGDEMRSAGTAIYFLLPSKVCTNWHRVSSDELWHFYEGDDLVLEIIDEQGKFKRHKMGNAISEATTFQRLVPASCWQRAYGIGTFSLLGCTVSPAFEFENFEMIAPSELAGQHQDLAQKILFDPFYESKE